MQKFLEELEKARASNYDDIPENPDSERRYKLLRDQYCKVLGQRALFTDEVDKEKRVVTLSEVTSHCLIMKYNHYGMTYQGTTTVSARYSSLICGESRVELE